MRSNRDTWWISIRSAWLALSERSTTHFERTGKAPGIPIHTGQTRIFGSSASSSWFSQEQKSLVRDATRTCVSSPITISNWECIEKFCQHSRKKWLLCNDVCIFSMFFEYYFCAALVIPASWVNLEIRSCDNSRASFHSGRIVSSFCWSIFSSNWLSSILCLSVQKFRSCENVFT